MSDLLKSFGEMKVSPGSSRPYNIGPAKRAPPAPPPGTIRASYPPLPPDAATSNRYYLFGWCLPENKWLDDFARANVKGKWSGWDPCHDGLCVLHNVTGYKSIYPVAGLPVGEVPTDVTDASTPIDIALCLSSTRSAKHFWRRPTEAQLQHITQIMGCPPYWFKDGQMRAKYHHYEIY